MSLVVVISVNEDNDNGDGTGYSVGGDEDDGNDSLPLCDAGGSGHDHRDDGGGGYTAFETQK